MGLAGPGRLLAVRWRGWRGRWGRRPEDAGKPPIGDTAPPGPPRRRGGRRGGGGARGGGGVGGRRTPETPPLAIQRRQVRRGGGLLAGVGGYQLPQAVRVQRPGECQTREFLAPV